MTNRKKITNKRRKRKKLMVLVEVRGGQSLAFELTTACVGEVSGNYIDRNDVQVTKDNEKIHRLVLTFSEKP